MDCLKFPDMITALLPLQSNKEYISCGINSLCTNISLKETNDYIIHKIYNKKFLKPICKKLIFKWLLYKWATNCTIQFNQRFYKHIDGCAMHARLTLMLSDIHMVGTENEVVKPINLTFYKQFVDDIYGKRNNSQQDVLFEANFHPKIKLTVNANPEKFFDKKIILNNEDVVTTQVYQKENKKAVPWVFRIPKRYKRNTILGDLHKSRKKASNLDIKIKAMKRK